MELMDQQFCSSTGQTLLPPLTSAKKGSTQQPHWATAVVAMAGSAGALLSNGNVQYPQYGLCTGDKKTSFRQYSLLWEILCHLKRSSKIAEMY